MLLVGPLVNVDPTIVTNYEIGWDRQIAAIDGTLRVSAFHQQTDDVSSLAARLNFSKGIRPELSMTAAANPGYFRLKYSA